MIAKTTIGQLVNDALSGTGKFCTEVTVKPMNRISIFIDGDQGITIDDCRELTRFLESKLDRDQEDYDLTVSSAGAGQPMKLPRQFPKHVGRELVVTTLDGNIVQGKLVNATAESIELELKPEKKQQPKENQIIQFNDIKEGRVILAFTPLSPGTGDKQ